VAEKYCTEYLLDFIIYIWRYDKYVLHYISCTNTAMSKIIRENLPNFLEYVCQEKGLCTNFLCQLPARKPRRGAEEFAN
jgi:hypothetical protein